MIEYFFFSVFFFFTITHFQLLLSMIEYCVIDAKHAHEYGFFPSLIEGRKRKKVRLIVKVHLPMKKRKSPLVMSKLLSSTIITVTTEIIRSS